MREAALIDRQPTEKQVAILALLGRCAMVALFLVSGFGKLGSPEDTVAYIASTNLPFPQLGLVIALLVEIAGSSLLLIGLLTRPVAAVLALFSIATAVFFHAGIDDQMQLFQFMKNIAIAGGFLYVVALGPGLFSLDSVRERRRR